MAKGKQIQTFKSIFLGCEVEHKKTQIRMRVTTVVVTWPVQGKKTIATGCLKQLFEFCGDFVAYLTSSKSKCECLNDFPIDKGILVFFVRAELSHFFPAGTVMDYDTYGEMHSRITSPTCEDLGIPRDMTYEYLGTVESLRTGRPDLMGLPASAASAGGPSLARQGLTAQSLLLHNLKYDPESPNNPFSPYCQIPLPNPFGTFDYPFEPAFIRKRNERERERVRCVNDGYAKLRQHLPFENREKRISKVETLRAAIRYISHLRGLLHELDTKDKVEKDSQKDVKEAMSNIPLESSENVATREVPKKRRKVIDVLDENENEPKKMRRKSSKPNA